MIRRAFHAAFPPVAVVLALLAAWQAAVWAFAPSEFLVPAPMAVARALRDGSGQLLAAARLTGLSAAAGFALAAGIGLTFGLIFGGGPTR